MRGGAVEGDEVGQARDLVDEVGVEVAARRDRCRRRGARQATRDERQDDAGTGQERDEDDAEDRIAKRTEQQPAEDRHEDGHDRRQDHPDVEVLERADVGDDPREEVAAAPVGQAGRGERLDGGEEPDPEVGQDLERRAVGDVALEVAERGTADGEDADRGDDEGDLGDVA